MMPNEDGIRDMVYSALLLDEGRDRTYRIEKLNNMLLVYANEEFVKAIEIPFKDKNTIDTDAIVSMVENSIRNWIKSKITKLLKEFDDEHSEFVWCPRNKVIRYIEDGIEVLKEAYTRMIPSPIVRVTPFILTRHGEDSNGKGFVEGAGIVYDKFQNRLKTYTMKYTI